MSLNIPKGHVAHWRKTDKGYSVEFERFLAADQIKYDARARDAERGSAKLLEAMRDVFAAFALRHGVTLRDSQLMLMNGEGL